MFPQRRASGPNSKGIMLLHIDRKGRRTSIISRLFSLLLLILAPLALAFAQQRQWSTESVAAGLSSSIAVDHSGSIHVTFLAPDATVKYAFRARNNRQWAAMSIAPTHSIVNIYPRVVVDHNDEP